MELPAIDPNRAAELMREGAALIDIRSLAEHRKQRIKGALCLPAELVNAALLPEKPGLIFACHAGRRTALHADKLARAAQGRGPAYQLEGGLDAWEKAGLPTEGDPSAPLEIMRQVQIGAGGLVLLGAILGWALSPAWHILSAFVGAGLVFAGLTGFCGMAILLMKMPWNRG